jgi:hypothetical protein
VVAGDPDAEHISTSYVGRFNLTTRMGARRFTRLTNAFSKRLANHRAACALHIAYYNLCRWHETIRCTPARAPGVADHIWTIGELIDAALAAPEPAPLVPEPRRPTSAATRASMLDDGCKVQPRELFLGRSPGVEDAGWPALRN